MNCIITIVGSAFCLASISLTACVGDDPSNTADSKKQLTHVTEREVAKKPSEHLIKYVVVKNSARVQESPETDSPVVRELDYGTAIHGDPLDSSWCSVEIGDIRGFVLLSNLQFYTEFVGNAAGGESARRTWGGSNNTLAYKLAALDSNESQERRYQALLQALSQRCKNTTETMVADMTVTVQPEFSRKGYSYSLLRILEMADQSIPPGAENVLEYSEVLAALVVLSK